MILHTGGPAYIPPISAGLLIAPLLSLLSPTDSSPQLILAALKSLNAIADSLLLCQPSHDGGDDGLLNLLYTDRHLATVAQLLLQNSHSSAVQLQIALTATLISQTCQGEHHRAMLSQAGVLDALAIRLASFVVSTGCVLDSNTESGLSYDHYDQNPPASSNPKISPIFQAISAIIQHSKSRAFQFLSAPAFTSVFRRSDLSTTTQGNKGNVCGPTASNKSTIRHSLPNTIDHLLPSLPSSYGQKLAAPTSNLPPLGVGGSAGRYCQTPKSFSSAIELVQCQGLEFIEEEESPLIEWLLYIARSDNEVIGLTAAWLLAILYHQGLTKRGKEKAFALLLVPPLSRMLDGNLKISSGAAHNHDVGTFTSPDKFIKEQAPLILAMLAANSSEIQKAAADAGVIKKLSQLLKESYDEIPLSSSTLMWAPETQVSDHVENRDGASRLGPEGMSPIARHVVRLRESVLVALADIASDNNEYRKIIIENGVIPFVIKTLKPDETNSLPIAANGVQNPGRPSAASRSLTGNPKDAVLAACGAARALSRSVSVLRTSLMDAGLTAPLFVLLKHQDLDLQIAATAVVSNLVLHFSPIQQVDSQRELVLILNCADQWTGYGRGRCLEDPLRARPFDQYKLALEFNMGSQTSNAPSAE